jgi:hypothetical protein
MSSAEISSELSNRVELITPTPSLEQLLKNTKLEGGTEIIGLSKKGRQPYVRKAKLPELKERRLNQMPETKEDIELSQDRSTAIIKNTFEEAIGKIAAEQVRLALESSSEGIRLKAGQKIIDHVIGEPLKRVESKTASLKIISHLGVPGFEEKKVQLSVEAPIERLPEPEKPKELRAAVSPSTKSKYGPRKETDAKKGKGVPLPSIGESPAPTEDPTPWPKL